MPPVTHFVRKFAIGDSVAIVIEPSVNKGMPSARFHGLCGKVTEKRGNGYIIEINDNGKMKDVIASSVHLRRM